MAYLSAIIPLVQGLASFGGAIAERRGFNEQAELEEQLADERAAEIYRQGGFLMGAQRAAYAASGVVLRGSPMDVITATAMRVALNAERSRWEGDMAAERNRAAGTAALASGSSSILSGLLQGLTQTPERPEKIGPGGTPPGALPNARQGPMQPGYRIP